MGVRVLTLVTVMVTSMVASDPEDRWTGSQVP